MIDAQLDSRTGLWTVKTLRSEGDDENPRTVEGIAYPRAVCKRLIVIVKCALCVIVCA